MKTRNTTFLAALAGGLLAVGNLSAGSVTLTLPHYNDGTNGPVQRIDTLTITLDNTDSNGVGQFTALPGDTIHFGFTASFSSNVGDWLAISIIGYDGAQALGTQRGYPGGHGRDAGTLDLDNAGFGCRVDGLEAAPQGLEHRRIWGLAAIHLRPTNCRECFGANPVGDSETVDLLEVFFQREPPVPDSHPLGPRA